MISLFTCLAYQDRRARCCNPLPLVTQVIGVKDERLGEQVCACIKLKDGQTSSVEEIRDFCKGQVGGILMTGVWPFTSKLNGI